jgi:hypothetical protein
MALVAGILLVFDWEEIQIIRAHQFLEELIRYLEGLGAPGAGDSSLTPR